MLVYSIQVRWHDLHYHLMLVLIDVFLQMNVSHLILIVLFFPIEKKFPNEIFFLDKFLTHTRNCFFSLSNAANCRSNPLIRSNNVLRSRSLCRIVSSCDRRVLWATCKRVSTPFLSKKRKKNQSNIQFLSIYLLQMMKEFFVID